MFRFVWNQLEGHSPDMETGKSWLWMLCPVLLWLIFIVSDGESQVCSLKKSLIGLDGASSACSLIKGVSWSVLDPCWYVIELFDCSTIVPIRVCGGLAWPTGQNQLADVFRTLWSFLFYETSHGLTDYYLSIIFILGMKMDCDVSKWATRVSRMQLWIERPDIELVALS